MMELLILNELKVGTLCFFTVLCALPLGIEQSICTVNF